MRERAAIGECVIVVCRDQHRSSSVEFFPLLVEVSHERAEAIGLCARAAQVPGEMAAAAARVLGPISTLVAVAPRTSLPPGW